MSYFERLVPRFPPYVTAKRVIQLETVRVNYPSYMFKSIHSIEIFFHYSHPYRIIKSDMSMRIYFYSESGKRESTKYCFDNLRKILSIAKNMQRYEDNPCAYRFLFKDQRFLRRTRKQSSLVLPSRIPLYEPFYFTISARCSSFFFI